VGTNGIGKSTALKILSGKLKPNLGRYDNPPDWEEILKYFRGSELQSMWDMLEYFHSQLRFHRLFHQGSGG
jgi:translation initiation factor RLI1